MATRLVLSNLEKLTLKEWHTPVFQACLMQKTSGLTITKNDLIFSYCVAHGVAEEKQKALFLTSIGQQMYVKLKTWIRPRTFSDLTLEQIVAQLKERTLEETIEIAERYKFFKRLQQPGETVIEYMSGLKQLASTCNFAGYLDTALRDQFVCGIRDQRMQRDRTRSTVAQGSNTNIGITEESSH